MSGITTRATARGAAAGGGQEVLTLAAVVVTEDELRPHVSFKEGTYARHRVRLSDHAELLVLCWRPGQRTPIHDHNGSFGAVRVLSGVMWETIFEMDESRGLAYS